MHSKRHVKGGLQWRRYSPWGKRTQAPPGRQGKGQKLPRHSATDPPSGGTCTCTGHSRKSSECLHGRLACASGYGTANVRHAQSGVGFQGRNQQSVRQAFARPRTGQNAHPEIIGMGSASTNAHATRAGRASPGPEGDGEHHTNPRTARARGK